MSLKTAGIRVSIVEYIDASNPGWVKAIFTDVGGREWSIVEKLPLVTKEYLDENSQYPVNGFIAGTIISQTVYDGMEVVTIDLRQPWSIASEEGQELFDVFKEQIIEI